MLTETQQKKKAAKVRMENEELFGRKALESSIGKSQKSYLFLLLYCPGQTEQAKITSQGHTSGHKPYIDLYESLLSLALPLLGSNTL